MHTYNTMTGSMKSIGSVSNSSHIGSKCLGLCDSSVLSLEGLRDRLVRYLTSRSCNCMNKPVSSNEAMA